MLTRFLGQGGMGIVWLARDGRLGENVALKFLPPQIRSDPCALDDLRRETRRSHQLTHVNIIRIHDLFEAEGEDAFISMEYVDGPTLSTVRVQQPSRVLDWEYVARLVKQLCEALDYAHSEKVIHRDLKPANLMLDSRGRTKLADFGIARVVTDSVSRITMKQRTSGTLAYMSPQQLDGGIAHMTDDIYSLGVTLYELLASKPPFFSGDIAHQIRYVMPEPISRRLTEFGITNDVPAAVEETVAACLAKDPRQRPQSARQVAEGLGLVELRVPTSKTRTPHRFDARPVMPPGESARRRGIWLAGALLVAVAAGAMLWSVSNRHPIPSTNPPTTNGGRVASPPVQAARFPAEAARQRELQAQATAAAQAKIETEEKSRLAEERRLKDTERARREEAERELEKERLKLALRFPSPGYGWTNSLGLVFRPVGDTPCLFCIWETRVKDFEMFSRTAPSTNDAKWKKPGFAQGPLHPVVNVSWADAQVFCAWLTEKERKEGTLNTNQLYRLPSDPEWSRAVGLPIEDGKTPRARSGKVKRVYPWGNLWPPPSGAGNYAGKEIRNSALRPDWPFIENYRDDFSHTAPVGSFGTNRQGLYDLGGNVWEWCQDAIVPQESNRVLRGGAWDTTDSRYLLSSYRYDLGPTYRLPNVGFRCVLAFQGTGANAP